MKIPVINPPKRRRAAKEKHMAKRKKSRRKARRLRRVRRVKRIRKPVRKVRKTRRTRRQVRKNPIGEIVIMGNPKRRRKRRSKRSYRRRNPGPIAQIMKTPQKLISASFVTDAASVGAGFIVPALLVNWLPVNFRDTQLKAYFSKIGMVILSSVGGSFISKNVGRLVLLGGGVSVLLDLWSDFVAPMIGLSGMDAYYAQGAGDQGMGSYYGPEYGTQESDEGAAVAEAFS